MINRVEIKGLAAVREALADVKKGYAKASVRAINEGLAKAKTIAVEEIAKEVNLTKTAIRATMTERKASYADPRCWLESRDHRGVPAYDKTKPWKIKNQTPGMHYGGKKLKRGYSFQFKHAHKRKHFKSAFMALMSSGHGNIWVRTGERRAKPRPGNPNDEKIKGIWSSTAPDILGNQERMDEVLRRAAEAAEAELDRQVGLILAGVKI
ncbi:phage tail protein [Desulfobotulus sp.]|uniref:phage tail protein n=1 Tax=Desulfobotulus sp. TaxID=1940337 RepID=UPI002A36BC33|nr:phage tail protein [Desulfobotulus sp.]MDY0164295.1 phage tail protein [Desulfobotulus sp.]